MSNILVYNILFTVIFKGIYFIGEKAGIVTENLFDNENMTFCLFCFFTTLIVSTLIHFKIKDYV